MDFLAVEINLQKHQSLLKLRLQPIKLDVDSSLQLKIYKFDDWNIIGKGDDLFGKHGHVYLKELYRIEEALSNEFKNGVIVSESKFEVFSVENFGTIRKYLYKM